MKNKLFECIGENRFKLILREDVSEQDVSKVQALIDNNQYLKGQKVKINDLIDSHKFVLYISDESIAHIKERHSDETKPGSIFNSTLNFRQLLAKVLNINPSENATGRVKWLGVKVGNVGKMGVKSGNPENVAKMKDYQMPDGKKEMVKISVGEERTLTDEVSVITSELGKLDNGKNVLSLITMFPGGMKVDGKDIPMDRAQCANSGFYFPVNGQQAVTENEYDKDEDEDEDEIPSTGNKIQDKANQHLHNIKMLGRRGMMQFNNILSELEDMAKGGDGEGVRDTYYSDWQDSDFAKLINILKTSLNVKD